MLVKGGGWKYPNTLKVVADMGDGTFNRKKVNK